MSDVSFFHLSPVSLIRQSPLDDLDLLTFDVVHAEAHPLFDALMDTVGAYLHQHGPLSRLAVWMAADMLRYTARDALEAAPAQDDLPVVARGPSSTEAGDYDA